MAEVTVKVRDDGPYLITGEVELADVDGNQFKVEGSNFVLCRCGASDNKPFCDGSHKKVEFDSKERA
ncbi:MAG TPA: CDGSH iron-sulfur domain-containing protein [Dehalococcoidia bacterium]|nr:CDGSH iron-sulfur domain-containing protein [Dehalococcoidia bacterium]